MDSRTMLERQRGIGGHCDGKLVYELDMILLVYIIVIFSSMILQGIEQSVINQFIDERKVKA